MFLAKPPWKLTARFLQLQWRGEVFSLRQCQLTLTERQLAGVPWYRAVPESGFKIPSGNLT